MENTTHSKSVPKRAKGRKTRNWRGLPQMIVELSALPEFGGKKCSLTMAYKLCYGDAVSARLNRVLKEALRRIEECAA